MRLVADENFNNDIMRGVLRSKPDLDIVRVQDVGLSGADDPTVLEWAASEGRILLTHDVRTISRYAYARIDAGKHMPGVIAMSRTVPVGLAIEHLLVAIECSEQNEWARQVRYLPLR